MKFCTICPIAGLEKWGTALGNQHLVLAPMLYNWKYSEYYNARRTAGDFIILDNGAYEQTKPLDGNAYYNLIASLDPTVVVLPDILRSPWKQTTSIALKFLDKFADRLKEASYRTQWMFVPQTHTGDPDDILRGLDKVLNDGRQGHNVTWVGLGRYLATDWGIRVNIAIMVKRSFPDLNIHALGMAKGSVSEMMALKEVGVNSIDSSAPVWRGWNAYLIPHGEQEKAFMRTWEEEGRPCNFSAPLDLDKETVINANLEVIRAALS